MIILELPEEILLLVLQQLDLQSLLNLYETCSVFKRLACVLGVLRTVSLSLNTLATVKTLQLNSFKDISRNLEELNLCAVKDLTKTATLPALKHLKQLKSLNISFTSLSIPDLIDIYKLCPTIKNVSVNFLFGKSIRFEVPKKVLKESQEMFKHFENVEFVGHFTNLVHSQLPFYVLEKANLCKVKFTAINCYGDSYQSRESKQMFSFHHLSIYLLDWQRENLYYGYLGDFVVMSSLDKKKLEFLIIKRSGIFGACKAYVSPIFQNVLSTHFDVEEEVLPCFGLESIHGNAVCMFWNKDKTKFDKVFFSRLLEQVKCFFPAPLDESFSTGIKKNWSYTITSDLQSSSENEENNEPLAKKKRIQACGGVELNFDGLYNGISDAKLSLSFKDIVNPVKLWPESNYLKEITYLSLHGIVHYSYDFFNILFRYCNKLITLNVEATPYTHRTCSSLLGQSTEKSTSLRNLRIIEKKMQYRGLLLVLSQCKSLENIHLFDKSIENIVIPQLSILIQKLPNLYSLFFHGSMSVMARKKVLVELKNAKTKYRKPYINVEINRDPVYNGVGYDPFIGVFNVSPIKPLKSVPNSC